MDILTEALHSMRTGHPASVRTEGRAPWGLRLPPVAGAGFHVVLYGTCWLIPLGDSPPHLEATPLSPGDVVFLRDGRGHILADHPSSPTVEPKFVHFQAGSPIGTLSLGGDGARTSLLCGNYHLDQGRPHPLVRQLPEVIHLPTRHGRHPELSAAVQLLGAELENPRIGSDGIVPALIDSLLLYILRAWLEAQPTAAAEGWASALGDSAVAPALTAIHADPAAVWTVESLARKAGLSLGGLRPPVHRSRRRTAHGLPDALAHDHGGQAPARIRRARGRGRRARRLRLRVRLRQGVQARVRTGSRRIPPPGAGRVTGFSARSATAPGTAGPASEVARQM